MILLGMETATSACAVGLAGEGFSEVRVADTQRRHGEHLMPAVARLLADHGVRAREVTRVVVDRGPGLFTGLRVGVASAAAFAQASGASLVSVTSLEMLAHDAYERGRRGRLVAVIDARRHEVFAQAYELDAAPVALEKPRVLTPQDLAASLGGAVLLVGDGAARYREHFEDLARVDDVVVPPVSAALALGVSRDPEPHVSPLYLRDADAVANFTTRDAPR